VYGWHGKPDAMIITDGLAALHIFVGGYSAGIKKPAIAGFLIKSLG
jgi:hypothetical protein